MTRIPKHKLPDYFIADLAALGWKPIYKGMEGNTGCFTRVHNERLITSFASLRVPRNGTPLEYRFSPSVAIGTTWFKTAYRKVSNDKTEYPRFECKPKKRCFLSPKYSKEFVEDVSNYIIDWATSLDLREALQSTATIPDGLGFPNNSFSYITAHAILGNINELKNLKRLVADDLERPIVGYVKINHIDNAIECCNHLEKYDISATLIKYLRGTST